MIAGLVLAAGGARRFGSQKMLAAFDGTTVVDRAVGTIVGEVDEVVVVVGREGDMVRRALASMSVRFVENPHWERGLSSSLQAGVASVAPQCEAVVVCLGDQPTLDRVVVRRVVEEWRSRHAEIVAARYRGQRGHPVLFSRSIFSELASTSGDTGARSVIDRDPHRVLHVDVDADAPRDIDTPDDLDRLAGGSR